MKRILLPFSLLILLLIAACGEATVTDQTDRSHTSENDTILVPEGDSTGEFSGYMENEEGPRFIEGEFSVEKAMEVVYGLYDKNMECSKWVCKVEEKEEFSSKMDEGGALYTKAAQHFSFETEEGPKVLLVTATAAREGKGWESCHACAPILGIAQFGEIEGDWFVEGLKKNLGTSGAWGELPPFELIKFGPDNYGLRIDYGYTQHGISSGGIQLIGMVNGKFSVLMDRPSEYSNSGYFFEGNQPEKQYEFKTEMEFSDKSEGDYRDLHWTRTGKQPLGGVETEGEIRPFEEEIHFIFDGQKYSISDSTFQWIGG